MSPDELAALRAEVQKDIALGLANFKVWLFAGLLMNAFIVGLPAVLAFQSLQSTANEALNIAKENDVRLNGRSAFMIDAESRIRAVELHLEREYGYEPPEDATPVPD